MTIVQKENGISRPPSGRAQRDAGHDAWQGNRQHEQEGDGLAPEELAAVHGCRSQRAQDRAPRSWRRPPPRSESVRARHRSGRWSASPYHRVV